MTRLHNNMTQLIVPTIHPPSPALEQVLQNGPILPMRCRRLSSPIPAADPAGAYSSLHSLADIGRRLSALRIGRQRHTPSPLHGASSSHVSSPAALREDADGLQGGLSLYHDPQSSKDSRRLAPRNPHRHVADNTHAAAEKTSGLPLREGSFRSARLHEGPILSSRGVVHEDETEGRRMDGQAPARSFLKRSISRSAEKAKLEARGSAAHTLHSETIRRHSHEHLSRRQLHAEHELETQAGSNHSRWAATAAADSPAYRDPTLRAPAAQEAPAQGSPNHLHTRPKNGANELRTSPLHARPWGWRGSRHAEPSFGVQMGHF